MYQIDIIRTLEKFTALKEEWNTLLQESATNSVFLTWEWLSSWWKVFQDKSQLFIITVRDSEGILTGIAPLMLRRRLFYFFPVRELTFIGIGISDRQDFIISRDHYAVLSVILQNIYKYTKEWNLLYLDQVPAGSPLIEHIQNNSLSCFVENSSICPFIDSRGDWEAFYQTLSHKMRRDLKNKMNKIGKLGQWKFVAEVKLNDGLEFIALMKRIEQKSRRIGTAKDFFSNNKNCQFFITFFEKSQSKNWMNLSLITLEEKPIAVLIGFLYQDKYLAYIMAFDEEYSSESPGKILLNEKIKWCFDHNDQIKEFDFSRGDTYIKARWTSQSRQHHRLVFLKNSLYSQLIRLTVFTFRPMLKKILRRS